MKRQEIKNNTPAGGQSHITGDQMVVARSAVLNSDLQDVVDYIIAHDEEIVKTIFELVKDAWTCSIFDLVRNPLVRDSQTWSGHKLQGKKITPEQWSLLAGPNSQPYTTDGCIMGNPHDYTIATDEENVKSVLALLWLNQEIKLSL